MACSIQLGGIVELVRVLAGLTMLEIMGYEPRPSQTSDLKNLYLSLPSVALSINRIGQGLACSVLG